MKPTITVNDGEIYVGAAVPAHDLSEEAMTTPTPSLTEQTILQLQRDLAAAQEALAAAEARAESNLNALNRFKEEREGNTRQFQRLQHRLAQSEADNFYLAAGQCIVTNGGLMGDDHGHLYCDQQRQRDELRGKIRVMAAIMNTALDVMKTVEGDGSDEDEALMHIRAKMASAIDRVLMDDKSGIDAHRYKPFHDESPPIDAAIAEGK